MASTPSGHEPHASDSAVRTGLKIGLGAVGLVAGAILIWYASQVLLVFFAAIFLAVFFSGCAQALQHHTHFGYRTSLALVLVGIFWVLSMAGLLIGPGVADQFTNLSDQLPKAYHQLLDKIRTVPAGAELITTVHRAMDASKDSNWQNVMKFAGVTFHGLGGILFAIIIGIFLASDRELYRGGFLALFPRKRRKRIKEVLDELGFTLWWWLMAQLVTMASVGIFVGIGLAALGVPLAGTLGLIAALLSFIPSLGPFLSVIPAAMIGLTISPAMGFYVCLLYLGVQTLEANVITPLVQQKAISLPPAFILCSELVMGLLLGGAGLAFATPLAAVVLVVVNMIYIQDYLGEPGSLPSTKRGR